MSGFRKFIYSSEVCGNQSINPDLIDATAVGKNALQDVTVGANCCAFGENALDNCTTGSDNCAFGKSAGTLIVGGARNTLVGGSSSCGAADADSAALGYSATCTASQASALGVSTSACFGGVSLGYGATSGVANQYATVLGSGCTAPHNNCLVLGSNCTVGGDEMGNVSNATGTMKLGVNTSLPICALDLGTDNASSKPTLHMASTDRTLLPAVAVGDGMLCMDTGVLYLKTNGGVATVAGPDLSAATFITQVPSGDLSAEQALSTIVGGNDRSVLGYASYAVGTLAVKTEIVNDATNLFVGNDCGASGLATTNNTGCGTAAFDDLTIGTANSAFGYQAMNNSTSASQCTAVGSRALHTNIVGTHNVCLGFESGFALVGSRNTSCGSNSLVGATCDDSLAVGYNAAPLLSGDFNVVVGANSGTNMTTSTNSVVIGQGACAAAATLTSVVAIGDATVISNGVAGSIAIGSAATCGFSNALVIGSSSTVTAVNQGNISNSGSNLTLGINNSNPLARLHFHGCMCQTPEAVVTGAAQFFVTVDMSHILVDMGAFTSDIVLPTQAALVAAGFQFTVKSMPNTFSVAGISILPADGETIDGIAA